MMDHHGGRPPPPAATTTTTTDMDDEHVLVLDNGEMQCLYEKNGKPCDKIFHDRKNFKKHLITHREKTYACEEIKDGVQCTAKFHERAKLMRHIDGVHYGKKPHECATCHKKFAYKANLKTHERLHNGDRPYACGFKGCERTFTQASNRNAHEETHKKGTNSPRRKVRKMDELTGEQVNIMAAMDHYWNGKTGQPQQQRDAKMHSPQTLIAASSSSSSTTSNSSAGSHRLVGHVVIPMKYDENPRDLSPVPEISDAPLGENEPRPSDPNYNDAQFAIGGPGSPFHAPSSSSSSRVRGGGHKHSSRNASSFAVAAAPVATSTTTTTNSLSPTMPFLSIGKSVTSSSMHTFPQHYAPAQIYVGRYSPRTDMIAMDRFSPRNDAQMAYEIPVPISNEDTSGDSDLIFDSTDHMLDPLSSNFLNSSDQSFTSLGTDGPIMMRKKQIDHV